MVQLKERTCESPKTEKELAGLKNKKPVSAEYSATKRRFRMRLITYT